MSRYYNDIPEDTLSHHGICDANSWRTKSYSC